MTASPVRIFVAPILVAAFLGACSIALNAGAAPTPARRQARGRSDDRGVWPTIAEAPVAARFWKNPYAGQRDAVLAGEKLFRRHCADCHGDEAEGLRNAPSLRDAGVQNATDGELAWFLRNGKLTKGMPPWAGLPEQRRWQIVTYLKSLGAERH
jgi:mono/diheme cytochrome c family protein